MRAACTRRHARRRHRDQKCSCRQQDRHGAGSPPASAHSQRHSGEKPFATDVAAGSEDGWVTAADPRDLHVVSAKRVHAGRVGGLAWAAKGVLLSGGWDKRLVRVPVGEGGAAA